MVLLCDCWQHKFILEAYWVGWGVETIARQGLFFRVFGVMIRFDPKRIICSLCYGCFLSVVAVNTNFERGLSGWGGVWCRA